MPILHRGGSARRSANSYDLELRAKVLVAPGCSPIKAFGLLNEVKQNLLTKRVNFLNTLSGLLSEANPKSGSGVRRARGKDKGRAKAKTQRRAREEAKS